MIGMHLKKKDEERRKKRKVEEGKGKVEKSSVEKGRGDRQEFKEEGQGNGEEKEGWERVK